MKPVPPEGGSRPGAVRAARHLPPGVLVEERTVVDAPPEVVWELIADLPGWSQWNPLYTRTGGVLELGETIKMTVTVPGSRAVDVCATVADVIPNERAEYRAQALCGLLKGTRCITIERSGADSCVVYNVEIMGGLLGRLLGHGAADRVRLGLQLMSKALKQVAEARWQGRSAQSFSTNF